MLTSIWLPQDTFYDPINSQGTQLEMMGNKTCVDSLSGLYDLERVVRLNIISFLSSVFVCEMRVCQKYI